MGIPVATICTDEFASLAKLEREFLGMPGLPLVVIPHPLGGLKLDAVLEKADMAVEEVVQALTTPTEELYCIHKERAFETPTKMRYKPLFR